MKEVKLKIPDSKYQFFMELMEQLQFVELESPEVPEFHKSIVRDRKETYQTEEQYDWEQEKNKFDLE